MKKHLILTILMVFVLSLVLADEAAIAQQVNNITAVSAQTDSDTGLRQPMRNSNDNLREETVFYQQGFDDGWDGWTSVDGTLPAAMWHLTDWNAFGGEGYSWWMGDPEIGGYRNLQYVVVDTPEILVTAANSTLTFKLNYNIEPPDINDDYDGWDGANIRISTDGGDTWSVISGSPAYNCTSMYSFGFSHGEGVGVPGWGGSSDGWVDASFDLSSYAGQEVMIRFAFASDPAADTTTNPSWFGVMVDNISLGAFDHDFNDGNTQGMESSSVVPVGGDLWHLDTTVPAAPSQPNAAICQNDQGSYDGGMLNYLVSESVTLPSSGDIRVDFMVRGEVDGDSDLFPNCDYWGWEISPDDGVSWYAMSNPYNDPNGSNFVYIDVPDMWSSMVGSYGLDGYISDYAGYTVKFRVYLKSIDHTPVGEGLMLDDFTIYHTEYLPVPGNLSAEVEEQMVHLQWTPPGAGGSEGWIHWDNGVNNTGIGLSDEGGVFDVAAKFTRQDLDPYVNGYITTIKFFPREASPTYSLKIWQGVSGNQLAYEQDLASVTPMEWNEVALTEPVLIEFGEDYWVGYTVDQAPGIFPAGADSGPHVPGKGDMIRTGASWGSLFDASTGSIDVNWNIQALVEIPVDRHTVKVSNLRPDEITGFNIYHSSASGTGYTLIGTVDDDVANFTHDDPLTGEMNYYVVSALYDTSESGYSNEASAFVLPDTSHEFLYDDGTAESGYNVGNQNHVAVKFIPTFLEESQLTYVKIYVHTKRTAPMIVKVWEDDGGVPAEFALVQFMYPASQVQEGWNYIPIPAANPVYFSEGYFFVGVLEGANASAVGVDEDTVSSSYTKIGSNAWSSFQNGNFMIRAIIDGMTNSEEELLPVTERLSVRNYPNPFNPETTIKMNLPEGSQVTLNIYNLKGQLVRSLVSDYLPAGEHRVVWDGTDNKGNQGASGLYFYRLESNGQTLNKRMLLLK